jgi:hypothetical protein
MKGLEGIQRLTLGWLLAALLGLDLEWRASWAKDVINSLPTVMFAPHPNLSDQVNHNIVQSEIEGGVLLSTLPPSTVLEIETQHHRYVVVLLGGSAALLSGHPEFCPQPVEVAIAGSTWGGAMLKQRFIGRGMHLEFCHPDYQNPIVTSRIQEIRECGQVGLGEKRVGSLGQPECGVGDVCPYD